MKNFSKPKTSITRLPQEHRWESILPPSSFSTTTMNLRFIMTYQEFIKYYLLSGLRWRFSLRNIFFWNKLYFLICLLSCWMVLKFVCYFVKIQRFFASFFILLNWVFYLIKVISVRRKEGQGQADGANSSRYTKR